MSAARILVTCTVPPPGPETLREAGCDVVVCERDSPLPRSELLGKIAGCSGAITMLSDRIDAELLDAAGPALKIVANFAVGFDNIDLAACRERGVRVSNTPGVLTDATADLAWALILAAARRVREGDQLVRSGQWGGWAPTQLLGMQLAGATLGVVGAGRIGGAVIQRAIPFGLEVLYCSPRPRPELEALGPVRRVELDELIPRAHILTLHAPMRPESRHLINASRIARMRRGAILINTARGALVDEAALVDALRSGHLGAAGFDVYEHEPRLSPGLAELENVVLLPHLGSATVATRQRMSQMTAENVVAVLGGAEPLNPVV